jgi:mRNA-degrading endonuclease RelE of RelBE toxin-antitoxin system
MQDFLQVSNVIKGLGDNPRPKGVRKIRGSIHRVRAGDWRVIYAVFDKDRLVIIGKVARRSEDTYDRVDELF